MTWPNLVKQARKTTKSNNSSSSSNSNWKKSSEETQTLRAGCSKAEPKIFDPPPQTPFPGVRNGQYLISWRWLLPLHRNPVWWRLMHANSSYRGNRPTNTHTHRQDRLQHTAQQLACSVMINFHSISFGVVALGLRPNCSCGPMHSPREQRVV